MGKSEITLYTTPQCDIKVEVYLQNGMVWLIIKVMGNLFEIAKSTINRHLSTIYKSGELEKEVTVREIRTITKDSCREVSRNLDKGDNK